MVEQLVAQFMVERLGQFFDVTVDDADAEFVQRYRWFLNAYGYVVRNGTQCGGRRGQSYLHRDLLGLVKGDGIYVDHVNHNPLDNRRANLRPGTAWENAQNNNGRSGTSEFRGVYCGDDGWVATHTYRGHRWQKRCASEMDAHIAVVARRQAVRDGS